MPDRVGVDGLTVLERVARNGPTFRVLKLDEEPSRRAAIDIELDAFPAMTSGGVVNSPPDSPVSAGTKPTRRNDC